MANVKPPLIIKATLTQRLEGTAALAGPFLEGDPPPLVRLRFFPEQRLLDAVVHGCKMASIFEPKGKKITLAGRHGGTTVSPRMRHLHNLVASSPQTTLADNKSNKGAALGRKILAASGSLSSSRRCYSMKMSN